MKLFHIAQSTPVTVVMNKSGSDNEFRTVPHVTQQDNLFELEEMVLDVIPDSHLNDTSNRNAGAIIAAIVMGCPAYAFRRGDFVLVVEASLVEVW